MLRNIFWKSVRDNIFSILLWGIALLIFTIMIIYIIPIVEKEKALLISLSKTVLELPIIKFLMGGQEIDFSNPKWLIFTKFFDSIGPLIFIIFSISVGSDAIAGEEERKTLDLLLSNPISRKRVVIEKFFAITFLLFLLIFISFIGFFLGSFIFSIKINFLEILNILFLAYLLSLSFGSLSFSIGCISGKRGVSVGISGAFAFFSYFIYSLSSLTEEIKPFLKFSLFSYYTSNYSKFNFFQCYCIFNMDCFFLIYIPIYF